MCDDLTNILKLIDKTGCNDMSKAADLVARAAEISVSKISEKVSNVETRMTNLEKKFDTYLVESRDNFSRLEENQKNMTKQMDNITSLFMQYMKKEKKTDAIEKKAAQLDLLQRFVGSKLGKAVMVIGLLGAVAMGVTAVYMIDHSKEVSELVRAAK